MRFLNKIEKRFGEDVFSFLSHSKNYVSADFFQKGLVFISIPVFTRILSPGEYGLLSIFTSLVSIFSIFAIIGGRGAIVRFYHEPNYNFSNFIGSNLIFYFLYLFFFGFSFVTFHKEISAFLNIPTKLTLYAIIVSVFSTFSRLFLSYLQADKQSRKYSFLSVSIHSTILIVSIILMILLTKEKYYGRIYTQVIINIVLALFFIYSLYKISKFNFNIKYVKDLLKFGLPLIPHALSGIILVYFDRIIINQLLGAEKTGLYSFAYNVGMIMQIFILAMNRAWQPMFYEYYSKNKFKSITNIAKKYSTIVYYIAIILILFTREIVQIISTKEYNESMPIIPIIILSYLFLFLYTIYANYSFYYKKSGAISLATVIATIVNIILNYIFIPKYGYVSAAYTTLVSYILLFLFHFLVTKYYLNAKELIKFSMLMNKFFLVIFVVFYVLLEYHYLQNKILIYGSKILILIVMSLIFLFPYLRNKNI